MLDPTSPKSKLLRLLIRNKKLYRAQLKKLGLGIEQSTAERRLREICEDYPVKPYDIDDIEVNHHNSLHIVYWKLTKKIKEENVWNIKTVVNQK